MYDTWVRDVELIEFGGETIMLGATNDYARDWLTDRLNSKVERIITGIIGKEIKVQFVVLDDVEG
jgi:chromosomal replication initiator protein